MERKLLRKVELHAFILGQYKEEMRLVISISRNSLLGKSSEMYLTVMDRDALIEVLDQPTEVYQVLGELGPD